MYCATPMANPSFLSDLWCRVLLYQGFVLLLQLKLLFMTFHLIPHFLSFSWSSSLVQTPTYSRKACCNFLFEASLLRQGESIVSTPQRRQITYELFQQKLLIRHKHWKSYLWVAIGSTGINLHNPTVGCRCTESVSELFSAGPVSDTSEPNAQVNLRTILLLLLNWKFRYNVRKNMFHRKSEIHQLFLDPRQMWDPVKTWKIPFISSRIRILKEMGFCLVRNANLG